MTPKEKNLPVLKALMEQAIQQPSPESIQILQLYKRKWFSDNEVQRFNEKGLSGLEDSESGHQKRHIQINSDSSPRRRRAKAFRIFWQYDPRPRDPGSLGSDRRDGRRISCPHIRRASPPGEIWAGATQKVRLD